MGKIYRRNKKVNPLKKPQSGPIFMSKLEGIITTPIAAMKSEGEALSHKPLLKNRGTYPCR